MFAEKCTQNAKALSFLLTLCSVSQHLECKCFSQRFFFVLLENFNLPPRSLHQLQNHKCFLYKRWKAKLFCLILGQKEAQANAAQLHKMNWMWRQETSYQSADSSGWRHDSLHYAIVVRCSLSTDVERHRDGAAGQAHLHPHCLHPQQQKITLKMYTFTALQLRMSGFVHLFKTSKEYLGSGCWLFIWKILPRKGAEKKMDPEKIVRR